MNNSGEVQTAVDAQLDLAGCALNAAPIPEQRVDPALEQLGLIPFDPDMWDSWLD